MLLIFMAAVPALAGAETANQYNGSGYAVMGIGSCMHGVTNVRDRKSVV